jgi:hypothetical protein
MIQFIRSLNKSLRFHSAFFLGFFLSCFLLALLLPELLLFDKLSLMDESLDRGFVLSFAFINDWLNGGIQLWNRFNELPYALTHFQTGFYDLHKFLTAIYFSIFEPGPLAGPDFRMPFIRIYIGFTVFIKSFGLYLLLKRFTRSNAILIIGIVCGNIFFSTTYYVNFTTNNFLSFFPLVIHLILKFLESKKISDFCWLLLLMAMLFSFSPYHILNYTYLTLYFFLISCLIFYFLHSDQGVVFKMGIKNGFKNVFSDILFFGQGKSCGNKDIRSSLLMINIRTLLIDACSVIFSFSIAWVLYVNFRTNVSGVLLEPYWFLVPWLTTTLLILGIFLLVNYFFGNYIDLEDERVLLSIVKIFICGLITYTLVNWIEFFDDISDLLLSVGTSLSMASFILSRHAKFSRGKILINELAPVMITVYNSLKSTLSEIKIKNSKRNAGTYLTVTIVLCVILVLPNLLMYKEIFPTIDFDRSRASSISPLSYFTKPAHLADGGIIAFPYLTINHLVDEDKNPLMLTRWWASYMFLGLSILFFTFVAIIWSNDKRKYIFLTAYLCILFLNCDIPRFLNPLHVINAVTNPFSFTNRSFHFVIVALAPSFLAPLVVMGIQTIVDYTNQNSYNRHNPLKKRFVPCAVFFVMALLVLYINSSPIDTYIHLAEIIILFIIAAFVMISLKIHANQKRIILLGIVVIIFLLDAIAWSHYVKVLSPATRKLTQPLFAKRAYVVDGVLPRELPLREYFSNHPITEFRPDIGTNQDRFQGMYYQFVDLNRYLTPSDAYFARHQSYRPIADNEVYNEYLSKENRLFVKTRHAIIGTEENLREIIERNLIDKVIVLNIDQNQQKQMSNNHGNTILVSLNEFEDTNNTQLEQEEDVREVIINLNSATPIDNYDKDFQLYSVKSDDIPQYMSTIIATEDRYRFKASISAQELYPAQGEIIEPFSFDIHNIMSDGIVFSLPTGFEKEETTLKIEYKRRFQAGIVDVFYNTNDHLGLVVQSDSSGWLLYHSPYGKHWKAKLNGKTTPIYRANGAFIAVPLKRGINRIEYSYMPDSMIPALILLSLMTALILLVVLIFKELLVVKGNLQVDANSKLLF